MTITQKIPCSVYIVTLNCGAWLKDTLNSVQDFAEVIILDSGSTDDTYEIAQSFDNVRIMHQDWLGYAQQKHQAIQYCQYDWLLNLDGDETLSAELKQEIIYAIQENKIDGLIIPINDVFLGVANSQYTKKHAKTRFFRKGKGQYDLTNHAHENIMVTGNLVKAQHDIYHYGEQSIFIKVQKNNQYSNLKAFEKFQKNKKTSLIKLVMVMPLTFFKSYIIRRSCLNGWRGFVNSMINSFYAFLKEAKLFEYYLNQNNKDK